MESFHCYDNSDVIATLMVAVFPNVCLWRRSLCSDLVLTMKNCVEPPSYARTAYVVAIWPSFLFDSFVKIWATCEVFLGKWFTAPPGKKFPVRLCLWATHSSLKCRTSSSRSCSNWPGHFRSAPKFPFTTDSASLFSSWNVFPKSFRVFAFPIPRWNFDFSRFSASFMETLLLQQRERTIPTKMNKEDVDVHW